MMLDDRKLELAKAILQMHFGCLALTPKDEPKRTVCAECGNLDIPWPCAPVTLALAVQEEVLAR
jgi:hypothetical protein